MTDPARVQGFLDVTGAWDPTLIFVLAGAIPVTFVGYRLSGGKASAPPAQIDWPLAGGAILFGIGWGLVGLCPGPAIVNLTRGIPEILIFCAAMAAGTALHATLIRKGKSS